jgi:hypothetical protein
VAGRLAYADPSLKVMLIEGPSLLLDRCLIVANIYLCVSAGANNRDDPWVYR